CASSGILRSRRSWKPLRFGRRNASLGTTNWVAPSETVNDNGANKFLLIAPPAGNRFYRLFQALH
ncbi:MAG: hypothetical protein NT154_11950, partial [Verrucomicrobia bacterium]|nr:hypothetical protein [Verrucomicrobiota bacterium]